MAEGPSDGADDAIEASEAKVRVKKSQLVKAIRAIKQVLAKRSANTNPLFGSATETLVVLFTLSKVPEKGSHKAYMIPLPHPMYDDKSEVCFLSQDPQKEYKEMLLQKHKIPGLTKVIGFHKLKRNFKTAQDRVALADSFDLFICDNAISDKLPQILGKFFYRKKLKVPIGIKLHKQDPVTSIMKAINGTPLRMPNGPSLAVKFGRCSMSEDVLLANASSVISNALKQLIKSGIPVQSILVQATDSPALPVWQRPRPPGQLLDLQKYRSDASSSAASDTAVSGTSETEATGTSEGLSDTLETLSQRDTISEVGTGVDTLSELDRGADTISELDSEVGDTEEDTPLPKQALPLVKDLKKNKRRRTGQEVEKADDAAPAVSTPAAAPAPAEKAMPPPAKKARKVKGRP